MLNLHEILPKLTLDEKASLCSGRNLWQTKAIERLDIPAITVSDGPHGLRKQPGTGDNLGHTTSLPATCFPPACTTASSWDPDLLRAIGAALGEEARQQAVAVLLGPGVNIKRNPLCGRNFEYFSEDPLLAGTLGAAFVQGVQSQGVGASVKHFAANNQETLRMTVDTLVDERALHEIYLPAFKRVVQEAQPWTIMSAYNRLNGFYCSEHPQLLTELLRREWGFDGVVVSDWGATNDRVAGLAAGLDLEMPGGVPDSDPRIAAAVRAGRLDEATLDQTVARLLALVARAQAQPNPGAPYDADAHHDLARQAATRSAVLLKNAGEALPLAATIKLAIIGDLAETMRYQGSGSSLVNPTRVEQPLEALRARGVTFSYAAGYQRFSEEIDERLTAEACAIAKDADAVVVFAGLTELAESEGFDRDHMRLPANQNALIERLAALSQRVIVVLFGGSPVEAPWIAQVQAVLNMYLPGQAGGRAVVDLLFGDANPSGKLAETYPLRYEDVASAKWFPGSATRVEYRESIFVGYRYFDTARQAVLFPFGHGLSYTRYSYDGLELSTHSLSEQDTLQVSFTVTNVGDRAGEEIAQLYVRPGDARVFKAERELKGFQKVALQPGESKRVSFTLDRRAFAHYAVAQHDWVVESGAYELLIGASSRDIRLRDTAQVTSAAAAPSDAEPAALAEYHRLAENHGAISDSAFAALYGPQYRAVEPGKRRFTVNSTLSDIKGTLIGRILYRQASRIAEAAVTDPDPARELAGRRMVRRTIAEIPLRALAPWSAGAMTLGMVEGYVMLANGQFLRGALRILQSRPPKKRDKSAS